MLWGLLQNKEAAMKTMVVALEEQEKKSTQKHEEQREEARALRNDVKEL